MEQFVFVSILGLVIFEYVFSRWLDYLDKTRWTETLPDELLGIYDKEKYANQQNYEKLNYRFSVFSETFSLIVMLTMLLFNGFAFVDNLSRGISEHFLLLPLIFFWILFFASDILSTPFSFYHTFVIEDKFGFNKTTIRTFFIDKMKGWIIAFIIGGVVIVAILLFYNYTGNKFWIYSWALVTAFSIFMLMFYSNLIVPLFNKQKPLEDGELKKSIESFCKKVGFNLSKVYVIDGSKRSTKANAYFTGFGSKKRIVLYDTLIKDLSNEEIVAVLAHEIGHSKNNHTTKGLIISIFQTGVMFFLLSLFIDNPLLCNALGVEITSFHIGVISFTVLYSPISMIIGIFLGFLSRKHEYQADAFAAHNFSANHLSNALKKLAVSNLSNLTPHPITVALTYSHPTLLQRLRSLDSLNIK